MAQKNLNILVRLDLQMVKKSISSLRNGLNLIKSSLRAVFRTAAVGGFFAVLRAGLNIVNNFKNGIKSLGEEFLKLRLSATETAAIVSRGGAGFSDAFEQAISMSRELSTQLGFSAQNIQEGLVTAARSGLELNDSLALTGSAMKLATANGEEFQSTINDLIGVTRAFGVELSDIPVFADQLSAAVTESNVSLSGLFAGLKNVASVAAVAFGETRQTVIDTTAALMTMNDAGIQGAKAGTRLRAALQKLMGGTAKTTAAFTKYGVNLFNAKGESQQFITTLTNGQKAMADSEVSLNKLKNKQFELTIAGKEASEEYAKNQDELDATTSKLSTLEKGLDNVYQQFTLAGGKLKPFGEVLQQIKGKVPTEVVGRAFGIRGGEAIMRLLKDLDKFKEFKKTIEEVTKESEKGVSITDNMYKKFISTVLIGWMRIKNTATAILGEIADGFFSAVQPFLAPIQDSLSYIFRAISDNKTAFRDIFTLALAPLKTVMANMMVFANLFASAISDIVTPGKVAEIPTLSRDSKTGVLSVSTKKVGGSVEDKAKAGLKALAGAIGTLFKSALEKLKPAIEFLGRIFAETVATVLSMKMEMFKTIGAMLGKGLAGALTKAIQDFLSDTPLAGLFQKSLNKRKGAGGGGGWGDDSEGVVKGKTGEAVDSAIGGNSFTGDNAMDNALLLIQQKRSESSQPKVNEVMAEIDGVLSNVDVTGMGTSAEGILRSMGGMNKAITILSEAQLKSAVLANQAMEAANTLSRKMAMMNRDK